MSNARINRIMSCIRMLCSFLEDDEDDYEDYDRSAAAKIKGLPKEPVRDIDFIPNDTIEKLYDKFMEEKRYRDATLLGILYDSGVRKNEVLQVEKDSIKEDGNATNKVRGKRGKIFPVLYFNHTKKAFKLYKETKEDPLYHALQYPMNMVLEIVDDKILLHLPYTYHRYDVEKDFFKLENPSFGSDIITIPIEKFSIDIIKRICDFRPCNWS